jgi:hypothetical protein
MTGWEKKEVIGSGVRVVVSKGGDNDTEEGYLEDTLFVCIVGDEKSGGCYGVHDAQAVGKVIAMYDEFEALGFG